ncbi:carboxypeptidase regulatory-like domain-containing protein [Candidatus Bathyarchaeota archaeon]|nr:carboxypeptidase regulatory-like domain-containing protein [Candidatus Bathyarchaeota archaeon]
MNHKIVAVSILFVLAFSILTLPLATLGQNSMGINILQLTPSDAVGSKGENVNLIGTIYTSNGSYQVFIGKTMVAQGNAQGYYVEANFTVPELPAASYALILRDVKINVNASDTFTVQTGYDVTPSSSSIQEGGSVTLTAAVYGGSLGTSYGATVTVTSPSGTTYTATTNLGTPDVKGTASKTLTFPSSDFSSSGDTAASGSYKLSFNTSLATNSFNVNILDEITYHRGQSMTIRAIGYTPDSAATITIAGSSGTIETLSVTADSSGVIQTTWTVASSTPIGDCSVKISGSGKSTEDKQTFTVSGYSVTIKVVNLSGTAVPGINVESVDSATGTKTNQTSDSSGSAVFGLETGVHKLTAYWNSVKVGETDITVTGDGTFTLTCQLSDMKITVKGKDGTPIPFVDLAISYQTQGGSGSSTGQTGPAGSYTLSSTVAGATYTIAASLYGQIFNSGNNTAVSQSTATTQVTIICPSEVLTLTVTGYNNQAISGAKVELIEVTNGLFYSATVGSDGVANLEANFGTYRLKIYKDNALIRETTQELFASNQKTVRCTIYGIDLSVKVVDLLGSPISNAQVTINGAQQTSASTASDGKATFGSIIGGDMQIVAQIQGTSGASQAIAVYVNEPTTVQVKLENYVSVGGMLMQASTLTTIIIVLAIAVIFAIIEVVRRKKPNLPL